VFEIPRCHCEMQLATAGPAGRDLWSFKTHLEQQLLHVSSNVCSFTITKDVRRCRSFQHKPEDNLVYIEAQNISFINLLLLSGEGSSSVALLKGSSLVFPLKVFFPNFLGVFPDPNMSGLVSDPRNNM